MKKRIIVKQRDISDCGAACLVSVAAYYQLQLPVTRARQYAGTGKQGTSILGLIEAATRLNFLAKGARGAPESLSKIPLPAIAHIKLPDGLNHYVVLYKINARNITIMDPGNGRLYKESREVFLKKWTGIIVILLPGDDFKKTGRRVSVFQRFWQLISPHRKMMLQAFLGAIVYTMLGLSTSLYVQKIFDFVLMDNNSRLFNLMSVIMIVLLFFQLITGYFKSLIGLQTGQYLDARLVLGYYKHLLRLPQRFFDTMRVGEIISRVNDAVKIRVFINDIALNIAVNILIVGFSISVMFLYYWKLAFVMLSILPFYFLIYRISNGINKKWERRIMENAAALETQIVESISAASTIKRFGIEEHNNYKTESRFMELLRSMYKSNNKNLYVNNACELLTQLFTIIILWLGSYFVIRRELSAGQLLSFYALIGYFTHPAFSLINANKSMQDALIAADRLFEIIDLETETNEEKKIELSPQLAGDIQLKEVNFRYETGIPVFTNLNLFIPKNSITAIVGESGSGKSTLLGLLQNIYPVNDGNIFIGETNIRYFSNKSLRQNIGVVPQKIDLFAGSIIENIALGEYQPQLETIMHLSYLLGINEFVDKLQEGFNTLLSEQGINLSGGQRQRLAIARALYRNPEILILDEATASLDPPGEQKVWQTIQWFKNQHKTIIVIAHKLSMIKNADHIVVLKDGEVVEKGSHAELLNQKGYYEKLFKEKSEPGFNND